MKKIFSFIKESYNKRLRKLLAISFICFFVVGLIIVVNESNDQIYTINQQITERKSQIKIEQQKIKDIMLSIDSQIYKNTFGFDPAQNRRQRMEETINNSIEDSYLSDYELNKLERRKESIESGYYYKNFLLISLVLVLLIPLLRLIKIVSKKIYLKSKNLFSKISSKFLQMPSFQKFLLILLSAIVLLLLIITIALL